MSTPSVGPRHVAQDDHWKSDVDRTDATRAKDKAPARVITDADVARAFERLDRAYEASLAAAANNAKVPAPDHGILYVGLNAESAEAEERALAKTGKVRAVTSAASQRATIDGIKYDFSNPAQISAFVDTLKLDPRRVPDVVAAITAAEPTSRGKIAQIAAVFAEAERGTPIPSRLVVSAHSGGENLYGMNGELTVRDLQRLAAAMPHAAACIEDIHLSACSTSGQAGLDAERATWLAAFPKLKTLWAYAGSSPLAPTRHLEAWGRATSGPHDTLSVPSDVSKQRVAVWTKAGGYHDDVSVASLRKQQAAADSRFRDFLSGARSADRRVVNAQHQDALLDYEAYRVLSQKNELAPAERAALAQKADQLLRIRYYAEGVRAEFARRYGGSVKEGFAALGMHGDFATMSRKEAVEKIAEFEAKLASARPVPAAAERLAPVLRGLRDLDPRIVPTSDCHH